MKLLLSSDGKTAIENIHLLVDKPASQVKLAWIITASKADDNVDFLNWDLQAFLQEGIKPGIYDISEKTLDDFEKELAGYDLIFMEGGNTFYLLKTIKETGFDKFLEEWLQTKPYIGVSAGSYIMCPTIEMATWLSNKRDRHGLIDLTALGYADFLMSVHYDPEHLELIEKGMRNAKNNLKILRDGQALFLQDAKYKLIGSDELINFEEISAQA